MAGHIVGQNPGPARIDEPLSIRRQTTWPSKLEWLSSINSMIGKEDIIYVLFGTLKPFSGPSRRILQAEPWSYREPLAVRDDHLCDRLRPVASLPADTRWLQQKEPPPWK